MVHKSLINYTKKNEKIQLFINIFIFFRVYDSSLNSLRFNLMIKHLKKISV